MILGCRVWHERVHEDDITSFASELYVQKFRKLACHISTDGLTSTN